MMTGVRMELRGRTLTLLATDRYRLARARDALDARTTPKRALNALVPARTLDDTAKTLGPLGGNVTIALSQGAAGEGMIGFAGGTRRTTCRLLDGEFPPVRWLFPDGHNAQARVSVVTTDRGGRRVGLVAERTTPVR